MMYAAPHLVLAGEGGHAHQLSTIALAESLTECLPGASITFVGSGRAVERHFFRERNFGYLAIPAQGSPHGPLESLCSVAENFVGYWVSRWILREQRVSLVIGCGGLASGIVARAATARGLPTVLVEPNIVPSRTARWLSRSVSEICTAFPETATLLPTNASIHVTGFPVPAGVAALAAAPPAALRVNENHPRRLVILGGSSGAVSLNHAAPAALGRLRRCLEGWDVVHQTGPGQLQAVEERYAQSGANALAVSLIDDLAHVLAETDLVVCRAGGGTLAELAVAGVPAILLPHPDAPDDHQRANAEVYARAGACRVIDEEACEGRLDESLGREIELLLSDSSARAGMATGMRSFSRPGAAQEIAALCASLLSASGEITAAAA